MSQHLMYLRKVTPLPTNFSEMYKVEEEAAENTTHQARIKLVFMLE